MIETFGATRRRLCLAAVASGMAMAAAPVLAQDYPSRTVTMVVPFAAGGATDVTARRFAETLAQTLGTTVIVENKPSAGGFIAGMAVANAPKDGYTLLFSGTSSMSLTPLIYRKMPYSPGDLLPVSTVSRQAFTVTANIAIPAKSVAEFVAYAKTKPDGVNFGTVGIGTVSHILAEWIGHELGIKIRTIPYKGTSQATVDLMSGQIDVQIDGMSTGVTMHNAGKTRLLAAMGQERAILPAGVANFSEVGYPQLVSYAEFGLMAPRGTPEAVINKLFAALTLAVKTPEFVSKLAANGEIAVTSASPKAYAERIEAERARWIPIVKPLNLQLD